MTMRNDLAGLEELYLRMLLIRAFETKITELFEQKAFRGPAHQYIGMEAIAVGVCASLRDDDYISSTHRGHGHCIAKGLELRPMMAEILGRATGYCKGKGGSMHITALRHGMLGTDAVVGGSLAIAVGAAYGLQLQGKDSVTVAFFGDGAINQGLFHEAANLAAVLASPVVFVCENNQWAISTPIETATRIGDLANRAAAYGFPGEVVDGNDVVAVRDVAGAAVARARVGGGPTLIEAKSFRVRGHGVSSRDDRSPELISAWEKRDPITRIEQRLAEEHGVKAERLRELGERIDAEILDAVEYALASPAPEPETAIDDVYAPSSWSKPGRLA